ncbi:carboxymuconolactone decarboxylase family protein [Streptomyces mirabilis]|uniref:carboxymuconolactone decarboxylase family protein n=1 Tax=Streptomyces mirabilis TaxID=68239 RepID=UPI0036E3E18D
MPHIALSNSLPGITGLLAHRPDTAEPLGHLADVLLRTASQLAPGERELIAAYVSELNQTPFCAASHGAFAAAQLPDGENVVKATLTDPDTAAVTERIRSLLRIAAEVVRTPRPLSDEAVAAARTAGATDDDIHDTVLIAAAFCMFNRYVSALATELPADPAYYAETAQRVLTGGYRAPRTTAAS